MKKQIIAESSILDPEFRKYCGSNGITLLPTNGSPLEIMTLYFIRRPFSVIVREHEKYLDLCNTLAGASIDPGLVMLTRSGSESIAHPLIRTVRRDDTDGLKAVIDELCLEYINRNEGFSSRFDHYADNYIYEILGQLGFRLKNMGTKYLHDVLKMMYTGRFDSTALVTKDIYPCIAERYNTTPGAIERNIRTAIVHYWDNQKSFKCLGAIALPLAENNITPGNKETIKYISSRIVPELNAKKAEMQREFLANM